MLDFIDDLLLGLLDILWLEVGGLVVDLCLFVLLLVLDLFV